MKVLQPILALHRWLGVGIGLVMTIWCLSGFVMMYSDYPRLEPAEQIRGLSPLPHPGGERLKHIALAEERKIASARVEMLADRAILRISPGVPALYDLASGAPLEVPASDMKVLAQAFGTHAGIRGRLRSLAETPIDQWTVQAYFRNAPLYRADFDDAAGTRIYISGRSGEVVQQASRAERFWGWLGAVPHWLYPTLLRQQSALWSQVVIGASLLGCFLTITGIAVGLARLRRAKCGLGSSFRGLSWWHHTLGLVFGLLTLTWVASGLFSMNPWGFLDSAAGLRERERLTGSMQWSEVRAALTAVPALPSDTVRLETAPLGGRVFILATQRNGAITRLSADGAPAPLNGRELKSALTTAFPLRALILLRKHDAYYYDHRSSAPLPIWRATLADKDGTQIYIDAASGRLVRAFDGKARAFRWLHNGLHSLDFPILRQSPLWDLTVLPLLAAVTAVCATGTWMAWRKVRRDLRRRRPSARRSLASAAPA